MRASGGRPAPNPGPVGERYALHADWLFGGALDAPLPVDWPDDAMAGRAADPAADDSGFAVVQLPHTVVPLSWTEWDPATWEKVWTYRRHFDLPESMRGDRVFLDFEAVGATATVTVNGRPIGRHWGGYLPFSYEITDAVQAHDNVLAVLVDGRFNLNVPPNIPDPVPSEAVDFWQPAGITGAVELRIEPAVFVRDVVAIARDVLEPSVRHLRISAFVDAAVDLADVRLEATLERLDGHVVASAVSTGSALAAGSAELTVTIGDLADVELWDVDSPVLYRVVTGLRTADGTIARHRTRIGFREARFELDGFHLNGRRLYLFGANRHQHFPFAGFAMPDRVQRRDAEILRNELNCVMVRCSHYPQRAAFLDACDELGLLVWEESPGWQYVGDELWRRRAEEDIAAMVVRDRNRPSVVIWAARLNETPDHPDWYARTESLVKSLDDTRATSGTTHSTYRTTPSFQHDVFAYDDYSIDVLPDGDRRPSLQPPRPDRPYLVAESVTSWSSPSRLYRRSDSAEVQQHQAMDYAYVHERARSDQRFAGLLAWSAIDYQAGHVVHHRGMKTSGLVDTFRVPKPGAAMYRAQIDRSVRTVLEPAFTWDPRGASEMIRGPGAGAVIFSNCDRIEVRVGGRDRGSAVPDRAGFPHLVTPPTFVDLSLDGASDEDLVLEGYVGDERVIVRRFSGTHDGDRLSVVADDPEIVADGMDATRIRLAVVDRFGESRGRSDARLAVEIDGPGVLVGEPVLDLADTGAVGAVWVRSRAAGQQGVITVRVSDARLGSASTRVRVRG